LFGEVKVRRYEWDVEYTTERYLNLLDTYSGNGVLEKDSREGLFGGIRDLIDGKFRGGL
jgi:hypothetical protein